MLEAAPKGAIPCPLSKDIHMLHVKIAFKSSHLGESTFFLCAILVWRIIFNSTRLVLPDLLYLGQMMTLTGAAAASNYHLVSLTP